MKAARFLCVFLAACGFGRPGQEQLGDEAWHDARWADAVTAYRAAGDSPRLTAKLADAALQGGLLSDAADAWTRLGTIAPDRVPEAAAGLIRVATAADRGGQQLALAKAVLGLRRIAPGWPLGRVAGGLRDVSGVSAGEAAEIIPAVLAAAPGHFLSDPLLVELGRADRTRGACDVAVPILEGVLRTTTNAGLHDTATTTLGWCELALGLKALGDARLADAELWLDRAVNRDRDGAVGRRALLGFGDARAAEGDSASARTAWYAVTTSTGTPDSLTELALQRLQQMTPTVVGDTGATRKVRP